MATMDGREVSRKSLFGDTGSSDDEDVISDEDRSSHHKRDVDESKAAARAALEAYMARSLALDLSQPIGTELGGNDQEEDGQEGTMGKGKGDVNQSSSGPAEFAFRLFASSKKKTAEVATEGVAADAAASEGPIAQVVVLDDPSDSSAAGPGGMVNPPRPLSAYIAPEPTSEELARYSEVAVSGEDICSNAASGRRAWGWEVPWRVRLNVRVSKSALQSLLSNAVPEGIPATLPLATNALPLWAVDSSSNVLLSSIASSAAASTSPKRRPGKKRRIAMRQREHARREKEAAAAKTQKTKEEHLLEKKKRLNRIKKLRRREKKRESTAGDGACDGGNDSDTTKLNK